jgi:uroporphyrinogen-III synthase
LYGLCELLEKLEVGVDCRYNLIKMKRILVTRPRAQADDFAEKLRLAGFEPIFFPVIEIHPIEDNPALAEALGKLDGYEWVVFTSVNAVEVVFDAIAKNEVTEQSLDKNPRLLRGVYTEQRRSARSDTRPKVAAIGPKTAGALQAHGVMPDFVPDKYISDSILPGLGDIQGKRILLPRAEIARKALPEAIARAGGIVHEIAVYKTLPARPDPTGLAALQAGVDWITFTSPSTVRNFIGIVRSHHMDPFHLAGEPKVACLGPITEQAAREEGFEVALVAEKSTADGLIEALRNII